MTVICWDGHTLAADKQATSGMLRITVTKICRANGCLVGFCGDASAGRETLQWFCDGAKPADYPAGNRGEGGASLIVIHPDKRVMKYERSPHPFRVEGKFCAFGCGDESAMVAMDMGASAVRAVELVSKYNTGCGNGVDALEFEDVEP